MNITNIRVRLITNNDTKLKAVASIVIDDSLVVHDIKLLSGDKGLFIAMPSRKTPSTENPFKDIVHPINSEIRKVITDQIIAAYEEKLKEEPSQG